MHRAAALLGLLICLFYLFCGIGIAAYDYLCPNLHLISLSTGLSEQIIGATFIAFGNASVDIFSSFVALRSDNAPLAIGSIIGAAFFVICVVVGAVSIAQPTAVKPRIFLRDTAFLIVAVTLLLFVAADGRISLEQSLALVALYAVYAVVVCRSPDEIEREYSHTERMHLHGELEGAMRPSLFGVVEAESDEGHVPHHGSHHPYQDAQGADLMDLPPAAVNFDLCDSEAQSHPTGNPHPESRGLSPEALGLCRALSPNRADQPLDVEAQPLPHTTLPPYKRSPALSAISVEAPITLNEPTVLSHLFPEFLNWPEKNWLQKISTILIAPILVALQLSIPIPQEKTGHTDKNVMSVYSICVPTALFLLTMPYELEYALASAVLAAAWCTFTRYFDHTVLMTALLGFLMAVVWILQLATVVVDIVKYVGAALNISKAFLGLTIVAIGNSLGDLVSNVSIARSDHYTMAISACFGSPLLLILIGFGGSSLLVMLMTRQRALEIERSSSVISTCVILLLTLMVLVALLPMNHWKMSRKLGMLCVGMWVLETALNLTIYF